MIASCVNLISLSVAIASIFQLTSTSYTALEEAYSQVIYAGAIPEIY